MSKPGLLIDLVPELRNTGRCMNSIEQWDSTFPSQTDKTKTITNILDILKNTENICKKYCENGKPGGEKIMAHVNGPYRLAVTQLISSLEKGSGDKLVLSLFKSETKKLTEMAVAFAQVGNDTVPPASANKRRRSSPLPSPRSAPNFSIPSPPPLPENISENGHRCRSSSLKSPRNQASPPDMPALPRAPETEPPQHHPPPMHSHTSPRKGTESSPKKKSFVETDTKCPPVVSLKSSGRPRKKSPGTPPVSVITNHETEKFQCTCRIKGNGKQDEEGLLIMSIFDNGLKLRVILTETLEEYSCTLKPSNFWTYDDLLDIFHKNKNGTVSLSHFSDHVRIVGFGLRETLSKVLRRSISLESMKQISLTTTRKKANKTRHHATGDKTLKPSSTHDTISSTSSPIKDTCVNGFLGFSVSLGNINYNVSNDVEDDEDDDNDITLWDFLDTLKPLPKILPSSQHFPQFSLCFCSISTSAYAFDIKKASLVACDVIGQWLDKHKDPRLKIYMVDITDSETLARFCAESKKRSPPEGIPRFEIRTANLVKLKDHNIPCWYIVNASNPSFKGGGSGANKAIHRACKGEHTSLEKLTHKLYKPPAKVGKAYAVDLTDPCPLRDEQEVHCVIHVVGPNMSPKRPNYLKGDYEKGEALLRASYEDVLSVFYQKASQYMNNIL